MSLIEGLKNLNEAWVIVSRHNGNTFFKRKECTTKIKNYPNSECIWYSETDAKDELARLNATRKKCLYFIENSSKYFVNSFKSDSFYNRRISNKAISVKNIQGSNVKLSSPNSLKEGFLKDIKETIQRAEKRIIEENKNIYNLKKEEKEIDKLDFNELLKPFETQGDRLVKILYSNKLENVMVEKPVKEYSDVPF